MKTKIIDKKHLKDKTEVLLRTIKQAKLLNYESSVTIHFMIKIYRIKIEPVHDIFELEPSHQKLHQIISYFIIIESTFSKK